MHREMFTRWDGDEKHSLKKYMHGEMFTRWDGDEKHSPFQSTLSISI